MEKNNPISFADDERRFIWPKFSEHDRDIVVSIGTGLSTDLHGAPEKNPALSKYLQGLQSLGIVRKIVMLKSVLASTLDCEKMWHDFKNSLGIDIHHLAKCHRINIPFGDGQSLCDLDDVRKMNGVKAEALNVLNGTSRSVSQLVQSQLSEQMDTIARQLLASLFYLKVAMLENSGDLLICHGLIRCRLGYSYQTQFQSLLRNEPTFRVTDSLDTSHVLSIARDGWDSIFSLPIKFTVPREAAQICMEITLDKGNHWDMISGFPRDLLRLHTVADADNYHKSRIK